MSPPSLASGRQQTRLSPPPRSASTCPEPLRAPLLQPRQADALEPRSITNPPLPVSRLTRPSPPFPGPTLAATSTCDLFNLPAADECLSSLLRLQRSCPPARPNTTIASPIFTSSELPARRGLLQTRSDAWAALLELYPCRSTVTQILGAIRHGVNIGYRSPLRGVSRLTPNLPMDAAGLAHVRRETEQRLLEGRLSVVPNTSGLVCSPIGTVPKPHSKKLRTIHHLSHPRVAPPGLLPSVNHGITPDFVTLEYENLQPLLAFVRTTPNCLLWKGDLRDAFHHIVTCTSDAFLLGFALNSVAYRENALTFGGRAPPGCSTCLPRCYTGLCRLALFSQCTITSTISSRQFLFSPPRNRFSTLASPARLWASPWPRRRPSTGRPVLRSSASKSTPSARQLASRTNAAFAFWTSALTC